jgi:hypothetical protein
MLLDFIDGEKLHLDGAVDGKRSQFRAIRGKPLTLQVEADFAVARQGNCGISSARASGVYAEVCRSIMKTNSRSMCTPESENGKHPRDSSPHALLWTRDTEFYKNYHGKPCVFGHTPTPFLPLRGRLGRHGIYVYNSAIGIDTGYNIYSPLSCLSLPDFTLYQSFADGHTATHHITMMIPESLKEMQKKALASEAGA